jgi:hypothetical protein
MIHIPGAAPCGPVDGRSVGNGVSGKYTIRLYLCNGAMYFEKFPNRKVACIFG